MRLLALVTISFIAASLSGCAEGEFMDWQGKGDPAQDKDGNFTAPPAEPDNATVPNTPPVANLTADLLNGTAPLTVNFTLNATDADGDALAWTLTVEPVGNGTGNATTIANGTTLPATVSYNFTEVGNFSVALTVSDGTDSVSASVVLPVAAGGDAAPAWAGIDEGLAVVAPCAQCSFSGAWTSLGLNGAGKGTDISWIAIPAEAIGRPFTVTSDTSSADPDIQFASSCTATYSSVQTFYTAGGEEGVVPEGSACLFVWEATDPAGTIRVVVSGDA